MIYRLPTKSEIEEVNSYNLTSDKIISGFGYTIIGRGIRSMENKKMIYDSIKMLVDMYPDNTEYNKALNKIKQDYDL
jgi:hypothetical protein